MWGTVRDREKQENWYTNTPSDWPCQLSQSKQSPRTPREWGITLYLLGWVGKDICRHPGRGKKTGLSQLGLWRSLRGCRAEMLEGRVTMIILPSPNTHTYINSNTSERGRTCRSWERGWGVNNKTPWNLLALPIFDLAWGSTASFLSFLVIHVSGLILKESNRAREQCNEMNTCTAT